MTQVATRGTSNTNDRGSSYSRAARRKWLVENYRADVDVIQVVCNGVLIPGAGPVQLRLVEEFPHRYRVLGEPEPACRCYRCGKLLTEETLTVDRIIPGCMGGTYRRSNIRPACGPCNIHTGNQVRDARRKG